MLEYPEVTMAHLEHVIPMLASFSKASLERVLIEGRYSSYLAMQQAEVEMFRRDSTRIPDTFDYRTYVFINGFLNIVL